MSKFLTVMIIISLLTFNMANAEEKSFSETPKDAAIRIIKSDNPPAYNPKDLSEEELNHAEVINSRLRLNFLMSSDEVSEELRACYALRIIQEKKQSLKKSGISSEAILKNDEGILSNYLRKLHSAK